MMMDWINWMIIAIICLPGVYFMYHSEKALITDDVSDKERIFAHLFTVIVFSGIGAFAAHRVGFYFYSNDAIISGLIIGVLCSSMHLILYYFYLKPRITSTDYNEIEEHYRQTGILSRVFYGGVLEEVIFRWSLLSLFVWLLQLVSANSQFAIIISLCLTSLLFALIHLPSIKMVAKNPKTEMYIYTIVGNIWVGLCAGTAFIQYGLLSAIIVHILFHITWFPIQTFLYRKGL